MKNIEFKLEKGNRISINLDRLDAVIEGYRDPQSSILVFNGTEEYVVMTPYDELLKHIPSE